MFEEILRKINELYFKAQCSTFNFDPEDYTWEIGSHVFAELKASCVWVTAEADENTVVRNVIYDIPVNVNKVDPDVLKLWKEIKVDG